MPKYNKCEINCILEKESKSALVCDKPSPPTFKHTSRVCGLLLPSFFFFFLINKDMVTEGVVKHAGNQNAVSNIHA